MKQFKEGAEIVEGRMTFLHDFLQKGYLKTSINGKDKKRK